MTGLTAGDFARTGTATGCIVGSPSGSGSSYTVAVTGCSGGTVVLRLKAAAALDADANAGPVADVAASTILVDRAAPTATSPTTTLVTGMTLSGASIPCRIAWSGSDAGGSGVGHYELARSLDGGTTWTTISASLVATNTSLTVGSSGTTRFRVRAIDQVGNVGSWATGSTMTPRLIQQSSSAVRYTGT